MPDGHSGVIALNRSAEADGSAERQLWCAVIGRALDDALGNVGGVSGTAARDRAAGEARDWFRSNNEDFRRVCDAAGYDPDVLRVRALRLISSAVPGATACAAE